MIAVSCAYGKKRQKRHTSDELVKLGELGRDGQVDALVTDLDKDTTEDVGLDLVGDEELLTVGQLALLESIADLVDDALLELL